MDDLLVNIGIEPYFRVDNPYASMKITYLEKKTSFFERPVADYTYASNSQQGKDKAFSTDKSHKWNFIKYEDY